MSSMVVDADSEIVMPLKSKGVNGAEPSTQSGWPAPKFHEGLGNHPLWQALMDEIEANRQADIAEMNRLTDLELENLEL